MKCELRIAEFGWEVFAAFCFSISGNKTQERDVEMVKSTSLLHELVLMRVTLKRVAAYLAEDGLPLDQVLAIAPVMSTMVRTVIRLLDRIDETGIDWDAVLDELNEEWEIEV